VTYLLRCLKQIRPVEPDAPEPVEAPIVTMPRHVALALATTAETGRGVDAETLAALKKALAATR